MFLRPIPIMLAGVGVFSVLALRLAAVGESPARPGGTGEAGVEITVAPATPLIQRTPFGQNLSLDFVISNVGGQTLLLNEVTLLVRDPEGLVGQRLVLNENGVAPGIETIPRRRIDAGEAITVFNPFHTLAADLPIGTLEYRFVFSAGPGSIHTAVTVAPRVFRPQTTLRLPLAGRIHVSSGSDFYAHHRRLDFTHPLIVDLGIQTNSSRYALDFVVVDVEGEMTEGDRFLSHGHPVLAPAAGVVVAVENEIPEGELDLEGFRRNPVLMFGNHVFIDHENGEFSQMGHFMEGSVSVEIGERVEVGQVVARVGNTGFSLFPHLHYELVTAPGLTGEGIPAYFHDFDRILGASRTPGDGTSINSGEIVESTATPNNPRKGHP